MAPDRAGKLHRFGCNTYFKMTAGGLGRAKTRLLKR
jgi:hypothetical protein